MSGTLAGVDWGLIGLYMLATLALGLYFTRRGSSSVAEYFVAGRRLSWWLAGTSIVATSFAADTPLAIARLVRTSGLQGNWYWWCGVMGFMACIFFFAPQWRRAGLLTDVELIEQRYSGRSATGLRLFLALHEGVLKNGITMGWVLLGMQKIVGVTLGWPRELSLAALLVTALVYTLLSGLWGVVATDLLQFCLAMAASICLMVLVLVATGGPAELSGAVVQAAAELQGQALGSPVAAPDRLLALLPSGGGLALGTFMFYVLVQWWGGAEGGGFLVQRLFATRSERHAVLALLWFTVAHFGLRCWPWILVGLASLIYFPDLADPEAAYPRMMMAFMPAGLRGLMVASLLAAFMSTISTHLNWGASYLLNDVYRPYLRPGAEERHYVRVAQGFVLAMALLAGLAAWQMDSVLGGWIYLSELTAGAVLASLARWYWWRVNAWSQISAMVASLVIANLLRLAGPFSEPEWYPARFGITLALSTVVWVLVTLRTAPVPLARLESFYRRVRPGGAWGPVARRCPELTPFRPGAGHLRGWALGVAAVYLCVFGLGWVLLGAYLRGCAALLGAALAGWLLLGRLRGVTE